MTSSGRRHSPRPSGDQVPRPAVSTHWSRRTRRRRRARAAARAGAAVLVFQLVLIPVAGAAAAKYSLVATLLGFFLIAFIMSKDDGDADPVFERTNFLLHNFHLLEERSYSFITQSEGIIKGADRRLGQLERPPRVAGIVPTRDLAYGGTAPDVAACTALIYSCCKNGDVVEAQRVFDVMPRLGLTPNEVTYTALIHGYVINGHRDKGFALFEEMGRCGVDPNLYTYNCLIGEWCRTGEFECARHLFDEMPVKGIVRNVVSYNTLIAGFAGAH